MKPESPIPPKWCALFGAIDPVSQSIQVRAALDPKGSFDVGNERQGLNRCQKIQELFRCLRLSGALGHTQSQGFAISKRQYGMDKLLTLLTLERQAQDCRTPEELFHVIVNDSRKLVLYNRMIVWTEGVWGASLERVSGSETLDAESQYGADLETRYSGSAST